MKRMVTNNKWIPGLVLLVVIGLVCLQAPAAQAKEKSGQDSDMLQPGQTAVCRDLEVALLSLKKTGDYINAPDKGQTYVVLRFSVKNIGKKERSARIASDLQWKDAASGMRNGYERTTGVKLNNPKSFDLAPGAQGEFEEVYMVPATLSQVEFHLLKGYNPKEVGRWMMPIQ